MATRPHIQLYLTTSPDSYGASDHSRTVQVAVPERIGKEGRVEVFKEAERAIEQLGHDIETFIEARWAEEEEVSA